jgi:hypothetical protein
METKTVMTDAQKWLREYLESDNWRTEPKGVWAARQFLEVMSDHTCGDGDWCAFDQHGHSGKAQCVDWDEWERCVRQDGEELNPRLEYPTAPPPVHPQRGTA